MPKKSASKEKQIKRLKIGDDKPAATKSKKSVKKETSTKKIKSIKSSLSDATAAPSKRKQFDNLLQVAGLNKWFNIGKDQRVDVLKGVNFQIDNGEFVVIFGPSGCGKSTLLHILLGLEIPSEGTVKLYGEDFYKSTSQDDRSDTRKKHLGMVYQQSHWIKALTVAENVAFPLMLMGYDKHDATTKALRVLIDLEMQQWAEYIPTELSGGQQQRVALARALVNNPQIIVADEPTGNLDYQSGEMVMSLLSRLNKEKKITVVMVTHDLEYIKYADRVIRMFDGEIVEEYDKTQIKKLLSKLQKDRGEFGLLGGR